MADAVIPAMAAPHLVLISGSDLSAHTARRRLAKHPVVVLPPIVKPLFSVARNTVNTDPFGPVTPAPVLHVYVLFLLCTSPGPVVVLELPLETAAAQSHLLEFFAESRRRSGAAAGNA